MNLSIGEMMDKHELKKEAERLLASADLPEGLDGMGLTLKTLYDSLRAGGFTRLDSLWLCGYVLVGGAKLEDE